MSDKVTLQIDGKRIENFISYQVTADLYTASDEFSLELANPEVIMSAGGRCELYVNDRLEFTGIIDAIDKSYDKSGVKLQVKGRDLMGVLVDSYCEKFFGVQGMTVKALAEKLIAAVPAELRPKAIIYQENFVGKMKGKKKTADQPVISFLDTPQKIGRITPGMTIFDVLSNYSLSRGVLFWSEADGTMVFGKPKATGEPLFQIVCNKQNGNSNNMIEGKLSTDISKRWSKVKVITQQQGHNDFMMDTGKINGTPGVAIDDDFPFYKPFVEQMTNDSQSPSLHAKLRLDKMRHEGFQLSYRVPGHSQGEYNWSINQLCHVSDQVLNLDGTYLITGRTFERTKTGTFTQLKLSLPGLVQ